MSPRALVAPAKVALTAALLLAATGCTSYTGPFDGYVDTSGGQPLGSYPGASQCMPTQGGSDFTYGFDYLDNTSDRPIIIDSVRLQDPSHIRLVEAGVVPTRDDIGDATFLFGRVDGHPTSPSTNDRTYRPAAGATIAARTEYKNVLALRLTTDEVDRAYFEGIVIDYHDDQGRAYRATYGTDNTFRDPDTSACF